MVLALTKSMVAAACVAGVMLVSGAALSAGGSDETKAGADVFESRCGDCHSVKDGKHKSGPSLFGVVGRNAGAATGFTYSDGMKGANLVWNPETLDAFVANPKAVVAQTKMRFGGIANAKSRADLLAFLAAQK
jgi:cytochrome c